MDITAIYPYLPTIFAGLMGLSILIYVVLDGFDLGVGILFSVAPVEDRDRKPVALHVQREVLPHHAAADQSDVSLFHEVTSPCGKPGERTPAASLPRGDAALLPPAGIPPRGLSS